MYPGMFDDRGCSCRDAAAFMDRWGAERSTAQIETLVAMIRGGWERAGKTDKLAAWNADQVRGAIVGAITQAQQEGPLDEV